MAERYHEKIDKTQHEIQTMGGPKEARDEIVKYHQIYTFAVDSGQRDILEAEVQLKSKEAKEYLRDASKAIAGHLEQIAERGRQIIEANEKAKGKSEPKVPSLAQLSKNLENALKPLKGAIESFRVLEEIESKDLKSIEDENKKLDESPGSVNPHEVLKAKQKLFDRLKGLEPKYVGQIPTQKYIKKLTDKHKELAKAISKDITDLQPAIYDYDKIIAFKNEVEKLNRMIALHRQDPSKVDYQDIVEQQAKCDPQKIHAEVFGEKQKEGTDTYIGRFYQHLWQETYSNAKDNNTKADEILRDKGTEYAREKIKGVEEAIQSMQEKIYEYEKESTKINAKWPKVKEKEMKEYLKLENGFLVSMVTARHILLDVRNEAKSGRIIDISFDCNEKLRSVNFQIKKVEGYKIERKLKERLAKDDLLKYVDFVKDENGVVNARWSKSLRADTKTWEEYDRIKLLIQRQHDEVKEEVEGETQKAEIEARMAQGKRGMEALKRQLGKKGEKYFEGFEKYQQGDYEAAIRLFKEYTEQSFSDEERKIHGEFIRSAKELTGMFEKSGDFRAGLEALKNENPRRAVELLNKYLAETERLSAEEKEIHAAQIEQANEALQRIGLNQANLLDDLLDDIKSLRYTRNRNVGNPELKPKEYVEAKAISDEIERIRDGLAQGKIKDFYAKYAELKEKVKKVVEKEGISEDKSILAKMDKLFEAIHDPDSKVKQKALTEFAKEARKMKDYKVARKYLEYALEEQYKEYAKMQPPKVDREAILRRMLGDEKITKWIKDNAKTQYELMKKRGNTVGLTLSSVEQKLLEFKLDEIYRAELRKAMTMDGRAGYIYQQVAQQGLKGTAAKAFISTHTTAGVEIASGLMQRATKGPEVNEALLLYNEYFKDVEEKDEFWGIEYNPSQWGAEDWDEFEDECIKFAFETAMSAGIGAGAGAVGGRVGGAVLKALARRGFSRVAIQAIERGGIRALRTALQKEAKQVLIAYAAKTGATVAAEGATMFALGTIQTGIMEPEAAATMFSGIGGGLHHLGESIAKAAAYRVIGSMGARIMGRNPTISRILLQEAVSGAAGTGIEVSSLYMKGQGDMVTGRFIAYQLIQNAAQAGGMHGIHRMGARPAKEKAPEIETQKEKAVKAEPKEKEVTAEPIELRRKKEATLRSREEMPTKKEGKKAEEAPISGEEPTVAAEKIPVSEEELAPTVFAETPFPEGKPMEAEIRRKEEAKKTKDTRRVEIEEGVPEKAKKEELPTEKDRKAEEAPISGEEETITAEEMAVSKEPTPIRVRERMSEVEAYKIRASENRDRLQKLIGKDKDKEILINKVIQEKKVDDEFLAILTHEDMRLLAESDVETLNNELIEKILKKDYTEMIDFNPESGKYERVRFYEGAFVGGGGIGKNFNCFYIRTDSNGRFIEGEKAALHKGVVKKVQSHLEGRIDHIMQREIDAYRYIRDEMTDKSNILKPYYAGENASGRELLLIAEKVEPLPGEVEANLGGERFQGDHDLWMRIPPEETLAYLSQGVKGLRQLHEAGMMHFDVKPGNMFVGIINGKKVCVIGDLGAVPVSELKNINVRWGPVSGHPGEYAQLVLNNDTVPTTPGYMNNAYKHGRAAVEWAKAHPNEPVPPSIAGLVDMAQTAKMLHLVRNYYMAAGHKIMPIDALQTVKARLNRLMKEMMTVPNMDELDANIVKAREIKDKKAIEKAEKAKKDALDNLKDRITMKDVEKELMELSLLIQDRKRLPLHT